MLICAIHFSCQTQNKTGFKAENQSEIGFFNGNLTQAMIIVQKVHFYALIYTREPNAGTAKHAQKPPLLPARRSKFSFGAITIDNAQLSMVRMLAFQWLHFMFTMYFVAYSVAV